MLNNVLNHYLNSVPPVPPEKNKVERLQTTASKAVPSVPPVPPEKIELQQQNTLSNADRQTILDYLAAIDETDPVIIAEVLEVCTNDTDKLDWLLNWADKAAACQ